MHTGTEYAAGCRGTAEIEAQSVAYILCHTAGLVSAAYSFGYVAHWSDGDPKAVRQTADRVITTARIVLDRIEPLLEAAAAPEAIAA